ncbi:hypothetical protein Y1Q_0017400 [Alligator mississippiensis]|uniref:Uncharacterized protein n=1 Tax=Alligator mississippiensis TaxID=8496 RepID=A0A151NSX6_ALLMI|nr:hypothetical protein Y1Q_0017400 [Alligator mississippiensis]
MGISNQSRVTEFIIMGFPNLQDFRALVFILLLLIYFLTILGNVVIFTVIWSDARLHTPMHKKKYGEKSVSKDREDGETAHEQEGHREYGAGNDLTVQIKAGYIPVNYGVSGSAL